MWYPCLVSRLAISATTDAAQGGADRAGDGVGTTGMWTFLACDAVGFAGLLIAYGMLRVRADVWPDARSRLALAPAAAVTRAPSLRARRGWLVATLALGAAFLAGAASEYAHLLTAAPPMGLASDLFASTFYVVTGFHALHVLAGLIGAGFMLRAKYASQAVETTALYWHFVDAAWMPIFSFIYLWPAR